MRDVATTDGGSTDTVKTTNGVYWTVTSVHAAIYASTSPATTQVFGWLTVMIMLDLTALAILSAACLAALLNGRETRAQWALLSVVAVLAGSAWHVSRLLENFPTT